MPRKQWAAFERVTAADVNASLADQSVMVFATTAARDAAIPAPTLGMQSAVTASPDLGAPRYWSGSAWTLLQNGASVPSVWTLGDASLQSSLRVRQTMTGAWVEMSSGLASAAVIHGISYTDNTGNSGESDLQVGTGAAGSEVLRWKARIIEPPSGRQQFFAVPYGVAVPAGTRIAMKHTGSVYSTAIYVVHYTPTSTLPAVAEFAETATAGLTGTAWAEIGATPPITGGCWVVGFIGLQNYNANTGTQFGFGAAGSEVAATGYIYGGERTFPGSNATVLMSPIWWASGTRLAARSDNASSLPADHTVGVVTVGSLS